jgi:hypothetical protein
VEVVWLALDEGDQAGEGPACLGVPIDGDVADEGERQQGRLGDRVVADALGLGETIDLLEPFRETVQTDLSLKRGAQIVLGPGPLLGEDIADSDGEGLPVGLDGLGQVPRPSGPALPLAQAPKREAQVVLGQGPLLGEMVAGADGEGLPVGGVPVVG